MLELEARGESSLRDIELFQRWLRGREAVLQLVARLRERLREQVAGIACHPAKDLRRRSDRPDLRRGAGVPAMLHRREPGKDVPDARGRDEGPDEVAAAALVLFLRALA